MADIYGDFTNQSCIDVIEEMRRLLFLQGFRLVKHEEFDHVKIYGLMILLEFLWHSDYEDDRKELGFDEKEITESIYKLTNNDINTALVDYMVLIKKVKQKIPYYTCVGLTTNMSLFHILMRYGEEPSLIQSLKIF